MIRCNVDATMAGKQAKTLTDEHVHSLLGYAAITRQPVRNTVIVLLSVKAGLRAAEIAQLTWPMVLSPTGEISATIELHDAAAKNRSGRRVPIHSSLRAALLDLLQDSDWTGPVIRSERNGAMTARAIVLWFARAYRTVGLAGCSSHSGRRTFVTRAARNVYRAGGSLRDVQILAGHRSIQTTERYIDGDSEAQHKLVSLL
jgi:integrase/recombinase XerD